ncbi:zinc-binding dehydrogenase [Teichococcus coralli]|uniref:zinc-binding dehydrogenase n=1 Tax=Teichococcus coralli TaxID=2545983 RepID=UPI00136DD8E6
MIDCKAQRFKEEVRDSDLVLDLMAGETQDRSWAVSKEGGRMVSTLAPPSEEKAHRHKVSGTNFMAQPNQAQLGGIGRVIDAGQVRGAVARSFPLSEVRAAQRQLENDHVRGTVMLTMAD